MDRGLAAMKAIDTKIYAWKIADLTPLFTFQNDKLVSKEQYEANKRTRLLCGELRRKYIRARQY